uniref:Interleukin 2 receptor, gamma a n=1 Tax=Cyprinus carpio carpio TaxID=630221 RepID=A0A9J7YCS5_CYPCA
MPVIFGHLRWHCITYRNATVMEITTWAQEYFQKTLSVNTIHRAIRRCRLKLYRSKKKPYLNMIQKRSFLWAKAHLKWTVAKWKTVLWSDESKFEVLFGKLGRHVIWTKEDKDNPSCYQRSVQKPASLMNTKPTTRPSFSLPFPSKKRYEFQVRARIESSCGESKFWSDWSEPVYWGSLKNNDTTGLLDNMSVMSLVLCVAVATVILIILSCLLVHSERLRIILIPVVPNAGRNVRDYLAALFDNYDGNVEKWLSMPKDLENGFKPNFTERACPVREYRIVSQSSTDSESILSSPTDLPSDYQCMHSYSSASTIPGSSETIQTQDLSLVDNPV